MSDHVRRNRAAWNQMAQDYVSAGERNWAARVPALHNGVLLMLAMQELENQPATERLLRPYFGMHRFEWPDADGVEFQLGYGDWIRLFRTSGPDVIDLVEVRPPREATTRFGFVTLDWARRWPSEQVWTLRKRAA